MEAPVAPQPFDGQAAPLPPPVPVRQQSESPLHDLARWIYTNNPFYAISASLVFWGLRSSFDTQVRDFHTFALMGGLVAYTLLLAVAALVVIRLGKVWQDGRTLLLLIVLMFLAISVSFDDALAIDPGKGTACYLGGLLVSVLVTEALLRGLSLRLPFLFRIPYYLVLGLFFLYPVAVRWMFYDPFGSDVPWVLVVFPSVAGLVYLSLLPAARRGPSYVRENGSPWGWPLYPWTVFFFMGLGVCGRSYYLCVSMHLAGGTDSVFAPYFVVPFLLAVNVLLLEMGLASRSSTTLRLALIWPVGLFLVAMLPPSGKLGLRFLHETFTGTVGASPLLLTAWGMAVFYAWAFLRRVPRALDAVSGVLLVLSVIGPKTVDIESLADPHGLPILVAGVLQGGLALRRMSSLRCFVALCCAVLAAVIGLRGTDFLAYGGMIPAHLLLASVLVTGALFRDSFARLLQQAGALLILTAAIASLVIAPEWPTEIPPVLATVYPLAAVLLAAAYGRLTHDQLYYFSAGASAACWLAIVGNQVYRQLRQVMAGLDYILWGVLSLIVAMLISLTKTDYARRWLAGRQQEEQCGPVPGQSPAQTDVDDPQGRQEGGDESPQSRVSPAS